MKLIIALALVASLWGCSADKISPAEGALATCDGYSIALNTLASLREQQKLSSGQIKIVDDARDYVGPYCTGPAPDVDAKLKDVAIDAGVRVLQSVIISVISK